MYIKNLPSALTNFEFVEDNMDTIKVKDSWLKITRVTNIGTDTKEIKQKVIRISPEEQSILYEILKDKFEG